MGETLDDGLTIFFIIYFSIPAVILFFYLFSRCRVVEQGTAMVVERWGKFHRRCDAGWHFLVPCYDQVRRVTWRETETGVQRGYGGRIQQKTTIKQTIVSAIDLRENVFDLPAQPIITRDNVQIEVHPMLVYRLIDPVRVAYETFDLEHAVEKLVQTTLRSVIGDMGLDDTLASREEIERGLETRIKHICHDWGLEIMSVEILEITPTPTVQDAMHKQIGAERIRRAAIVTSDGIREKLKLEAEGRMQANVAVATGEQRVSVIRAKGQADARVAIARAEAESVRIVAQALKQYGVNPTQYLIGLKYIQSMYKLAAQSDTRQVYFPLHTDVVGSLAEVGRSVQRA